jgi:hypothetical protein
VGLLSTIFGAKPPYGTPPFAPPHENTGGAKIPTTPETLPAKHGLAGFIDRLFNPSNGLGQFGQALVASGGGPIGNAMAYMMQANSARAHQGDEFGKWKQQYDYELQHPKHTEPHYWESNDGSLHAIGDNGQPTEVYHDPSPKMNFIPDGKGGGMWVAVPTTNAPAQPVGSLTPIPDDPAPAPTAAGSYYPASRTLDGITAQGESGNRDFGPGGSLLRSPAGAMGRMQVMPGTLARPGYGVRPGNPNDPSDIARVGRDYRAAMQNRYGGDLSKMWGAYNWGPGNLDNALSTYGSDWLSHAPPETRSYIRRNLMRVGG